MPTIKEAIAGYRTLRDQKKEITDRHKAELESINMRLEKIEGWLHKKLKEGESDSVKTEDGTAYLARTGTVKITDWDTALAYILENGLTHVLEKKLSSAQLQLFLAEEGHNLPGTQLSFVENLRVRK